MTSTIRTQEVGQAQETAKDQIHTTVTICSVLSVTPRRNSTDGKTSIGQ